jgi:Zn-dependent protease/predicted transcriptional regulator
MSALPVARLLGFEVRVHVSWAIVLAVITVTVVGQAASVVPDATAPQRWLIGFAVAGGFLLSTLAHELGHALVARRAGVPGGPVIVYFFGGAATPMREAARPRDEVVIALAGPAVSLALAAGLLGLAVLARWLGSGAIVIVGEVVLVVGVLDLVLGAVNLLPAFPLDGGRVVRGLAWARTGDSAEGLRVAARIGRWLGIMAAAAGIALILGMSTVDGLMAAMFGWFLVLSARSVERAAVLEALLEGINVEDVMDRGVGGVPAGLTLDTFADQLLAADRGPVPVVRGSDVVGILGPRQVKRVRRARWTETRAGDLMASVDALPTIAPETTVRTALEHLQRSGLDGLPVTDAEGYAGVVTRRGIAEAMRDRLGARAATS